MLDKHQISVQKNLVDRPGEVMCTACQVVMSRRWLKKPDIEISLTLSEVIYRCPQCRTTASSWIKNS
jgi:Zn finger protein HypA/HybF involved in hydrogenase expression